MSQLRSWKDGGETRRWEKTFHVLKLFNNTTKAWEVLTWWKCYYHCIKYSARQSAGTKRYSGISLIWSLLNKVPRLHKCPSTWVPKCLSSAWEAKCPSALSARVSKCPSTARVPWVPWESKCLSKSVRQSASYSVGLECWFSKLISTLRPNLATGETWFNFQQ